MLKVLVLCFFMIFYLSIVFGCAPDVKNQLKTFQALNRKNRCIQCKSFNIKEPKCNIKKEPCFTSLKSFTLTTKTCVAATLTCPIIIGGKNAAWGISYKTSNIQSVIKSDEGVAILPLVCNNQAEWEINEQDLLFRKSSQTNNSALKTFSKQEFTLHCLPSTDLKTNNSQPVSVTSSTKNPINSTELSKNTTLTNSTTPVVSSKKSTVSQKVKEGTTVSVKPNFWANATKDTAVTTAKTSTKTIVNKKTKNIVPSETPSRRP